MSLFRETLLLLAGDMDSSVGGYALSTKINFLWFLLQLPFQVQFETSSTVGNGGKFAQKWILASTLVKQFIQFKASKHFGFHSWAFSGQEGFLFQNVACL
jgi:hypothetical protein